MYCCTRARPAIISYQFAIFEVDKSFAEHGLAATMEEKESALTAVKLDSQQDAETSSSSTSEKKVFEVRGSHRSFRDRT